MGERTILTLISEIDKNYLYFHWQTPADIKALWDKFKQVLRVGFDTHTNTTTQITYAFIVWLAKQGVRAEPMLNTDMGDYFITIDFREEDFINQSEKDKDYNYGLPKEYSSLTLEQEEFQDELDADLGVKTHFHNKQELEKARAKLKKLEKKLNKLKPEELMEPISKEERFG